MHALTGKFHRDRGTDTPVGAGDQCDFLAQSKFHPGVPPRIVLDKHAGIGQKEQLRTGIPAANQNRMLGPRARIRVPETTSRRDKTKCQRMYWPSRRKS